MRRGTFHTRKEFERAGLIPQEAGIVVVKLGYLEPELHEMAAHNILLFSPGCVPPGHVLQVEYKNIKRPMYPLDRDMEWLA